MRIGILSVRNHRYHPNRRLMEAAGRLNHEACLIHPGKLYLATGNTGLGVGWTGSGRYPEVLLPRIGATIKEYGLTAVRHFQLQGIPVVNRFEAILLARNKFLTMQSLSRAGIPVPETRYASNPVNLGRAVSSLGGFPLVAKIARGRQGSGVFLLDSMETALNLLEGHLNQGRGVLVQEYIPLEGRRDYRVLVVGDEVLGAMGLTPGKGEFRSNFHLGGRAERAEPGEAMSALALRSIRAIGLDIAGVDVIEDRQKRLRVVELNYSPGFKGFEKSTGVDVASRIIHYAVKAKR